MPHHPIRITDAELHARVLTADEPVLVDFWAPWCGPCLELAPLLEELAEELGDRITIARVDTDENPEWADLFGVESVPTLVLFDQGRPVARMVGGESKRELCRWLEASLAGR